MIYLVRGIPGSGKSTLASELAFELGCSQVEADSFMILNGNYKFDANLLDKCHKWCILEVERCLRGNGNVVVSNTFSQLWEIMPYVQLAKSYGHLVKILEPDTSWAKNAQLCFERNVHSVPLSTIQKQLSRWEDIPKGVYDPTKVAYDSNDKPVLYKANS